MKPQVWQLQQAKARLSELIRSTAHAPQTITLRGEEVAVVLSAAKYRELAKSRMSLYDFLQGSPFKDVELDLTRSRSTEMRSINFGD